MNKRYFKDLKPGDMIRSKLFLGIVLGKTSKLKSSYGLVHFTAIGNNGQLNTLREKTLRVKKNHDFINPPKDNEIKYVGEFDLELHKLLYDH